MATQRLEPPLTLCCIYFVNGSHHSIVGGDGRRCRETEVGDEGLLEDRGGTGCSPGLPAVCNYPFSSHQRWLPKQASIGQVSFQKTPWPSFSTPHPSRPSLFDNQNLFFFFFFGQIRYHYKDFPYMDAEMLPSYQEYKGSVCQRNRMYLMCLISHAVNWR